MQKCRSWNASRGKSFEGLPAGLREGAYSSRHLRWRVQKPGRELSVFETLEDAENCWNVKFEYSFKEENTGLGG